MRNISEAVLTSMTEEECARWYRERGTHVIFHQGRYWKETSKGFYQPLHWLARLRAEEATSPTKLCWGFQTTLSSEGARVANGSMPVHILPNLESYDFESLSPTRRTQLRKCGKLVKIVELIDSTLLQEQGYEVIVSAMTRTTDKTPPSKEKYLTQLVNYVTPGRRLVIAGLIGDKLSGYVTGYAVNGTAYIENILIATDALSTHISKGLIFEFSQICRRSQAICELVNGLHTPENQKLCVFKERMGFQVKHIPAKVQMNRIMRYFIRWQCPHKYYRLTGEN